MFRTILAIVIVYVLICGLLGIGYEDPESYTEVSTVDYSISDESEDSEDMVEINNNSDYGILALEGDAIVIISPTTGNK